MLDQPILVEDTRVRVIVPISEPSGAEETDPDNTPIASIEASLKLALEQAKARQRIPPSQWDGIDADKSLQLPKDTQV